MLKRIYIDNFRCFVNFEYKPERKQLLLGANGSGKSSLLDAVRFLKRLLKGTENPFLASTRTRWLDLPKQILEIEALLDGAEYVYRVENTFEADSPVSKVNFESLKASGETVFEQVGGRVHFFGMGPGAPSVLPWKTTNSSLYLARLSNSHVDRFLGWIDHVHCLYVDAYPDAMDDTAEGEDILPADELENLADWYRHLAQADLEAVVAAMNSLREVLDGFVTLQLEQAGIGSRVLRASFDQPGGKKATYSLSELSDGQRQLIALYLVLHVLIARGETIFLDEVTNHVALREIQPWLLAAEAAVDDSKGQLILISHHPEILNQWAQEDGLRFFREENGHVRTEKFKTDYDGLLLPSELIARGWENDERTGE
jgi:energy-coupling factor transporter ATP-binding protein EcfA2